MNVQHDKIARHFILVTTEGDAVLDYEWAADGRIIFTHTFVPAVLRGRGVGEPLARAALTWAREDALTVEIRCSYVAHFLKKHPEYAPAGKQP